MSAPNVDNPLGLSAATLAEVDAACARFESAYRGGTPPRIPDYLKAVRGDARQVLLLELVLLDIDYRRRAGEHPCREDYAPLNEASEALLDTAFAQSGSTKSPHCPTAWPPPMPTRLGRYRVIERLGIGNFGTVYRAHDDELRRDVAIKVPHDHLLHQASVVELLRREARALATLRHPAIVPVYDVHFDPDDPARCFVVSQFMEGGDLSRAERPRKRDDVARLVARIAQALHDAHSRGIVHRDVKLSNILIDAEGQVQLADFGLALRVTDGEADAATFVGTPSSMSPEQARGEGHRVDGRADIFALGVVLYELLVGERPFHEHHLDALVKSIQHREPRPPRQVDDTIPRELERICLRALAKQPEDRYPTAKAMADDLSHFVSGRHPRSAWWKSVSVTMLLAATVAVAWFTRGTGPGTVPSTATARPIASIAVLPFQGAGDPSDGLELLRNGMADALARKLRNVRQLLVRSTDSVTGHLTGDESDPVACGKTLRVDAVLMGRLTQVDDQTRASVQLVRVEDGTAIWEASFDGAGRELFAVQDAIFDQVVQALTLQLTAEEQRRVKVRYTESREAYEAYIKGRHAWHQRSRVRHNGLARAIKHFQQAIDADPLFALAYVGLAESHAMTNLYARYDPQAYPRARAAAQKALELDPELTDAHAVLALVTHYYDWDFEAAEQGFQRAIELNPNNASAHQWYAELLYFSRRFEEGAHEIRLAARLDPLSPVIAELQGVPDLFRQDYQRAAGAFERALRLNARSACALYGLGTIALEQGELEEATEYFRRQGCSYLEAHSLAVQARGDEAREFLRRVTFRPYQAAIIHIGLKEYDRAFELLDRAVEQREERLVWALVEPRLNPIRDDPRFAALLKRIGRTDASSPSGDAAH